MAEATGAKPRDWRAPEPGDSDHEAMRELIAADLERRTPEPAREQAMEVFVDHTVHNPQQVPDHLDEFTRRIDEVDRARPPPPSAALSRTVCTGAAVDP